MVRRKRYLKRHGIVPRSKRVSKIKGRINTITNMIAVEYSRPSPNRKKISRLSETGAGLMKRLKVKVPKRRFR